jgi:hypothetical protein
MQLDFNAPFRWENTLEFGSMQNITLMFVGLKSHCSDLLRAGTFTPFGMYMLFVISLMSFKGRWIPSKMLPKIPGPNSTDKGLPVRSTGSPTVTPDVSSYTCNNILTAVLLSLPC